MNEKFTKGPWEAKRTLISDFRIKVIDKKGRQGKVIGDIRNADNANLIAAAPDMYEMLKSLSEMMPFLDEQTHPQIEMDAVKYDIDKLLAKARGEL